MSSPVTAHLVLIHGESSSFQQVIELRDTNKVIGRAQNSDIIWGSLQISRKHASLEFMTPKWYIRDWSTNGLIVNGNKLNRGELFLLNDADIISFIPTGAVKYRFRYATPSPSRPTVIRNRNPNPISFGLSGSDVQTLSQPSTSHIPPAYSSLERSESRSRPLPLEVNISDSDSDTSRSDSENSVRSESLLSLDQPDVDLLHFSDDNNDGEASSSPFVTAIDSDEPSGGTFANKRKYGGESDCDRKKKRMAFAAGTCSSEEESHGVSTKEKSDKPRRNQNSPSSVDPTFNKNKSVSRPAEFMTDDQIAKCSNLHTLKDQLKQCLMKLASAELRLKTTEFEKVMEKEEARRKSNEVESITAAIKEENYKKIFELLESELSCAVCNEVFIHATVIDCGHTFCSYCINEWGKKKQECPICRKHFVNRSRHIELENFITKMFDSFSEEMCIKRKANMKDREQQIKKAEEAAKQAPVHARLDFLAELQSFNEILGPRNTGRVAAAARSAADRRRSARIQDRVIDAVATGVAGPGRSGSSGRRGRTNAGRSRNNAASNAAFAAVAAAAAAANQQPPVSIAQARGPVGGRGQNMNPAHIPIVNLDDSNNPAGEGNGGGSMFPNHLLNWLF